jgi:phosphatidate cytidylyltransferase
MPGATAVSAGSDMSELNARILSAIVMASAAIASAFVGGILFTLVWAALALLCLQEWLTIARGKPGYIGWGLGGVIYAAALYYSVLVLRQDALYGLHAILFLFAVVWGADVGAYFAGRTIGGPKLAPRISPKKTWSGFVGGLVTAALAGALLLKVMGVTPGAWHIVLALVLAVGSVLGDLFESGFKRHFGVKDSGSLIPGHGGFLDRLDGFVIAAVLAALIGVARGGSERAASALLTF